MVVVTREIQRVYDGKWDDLEEINKRCNAMESRLGFPPTKKRYRCLIGGHDTSTIIIEYQWESLAALEAVYEKAFADPEWQALSAELDSIIASQQVELYTPLSP